MHRVLVLCSQGKQQIGEKETASQAGSWKQTVGKADGEIGLCALSQQDLFFMP